MQGSQSQILLCIWDNCAVFPVGDGDKNSGVATETGIAAISTAYGSSTSRNDIVRGGGVGGPDPAAPEAMIFGLIDACLFLPL